MACASNSCFLFLSTTLLGIHWANASITGARGRANSITLTHTANGRHAVWLLGGPLAVHKGLLMIWIIECRAHTRRDCCIRFQCPRSSSIPTLPTNVIVCQVKRQILLFQAHHRTHRIIQLHQTQIFLARSMLKYCAVKQRNRCVGSQILKTVLGQVPARSMQIPLRSPLVTRVNNELKARIEHKLVSP